MDHKSRCLGEHFSLVNCSFYAGQNSVLTKVNDLGPINCQPRDGNGDGDGDGDGDGNGNLKIKT